jgi:Tfp pilus assembly protein PilF
MMKYKGTRKPLREIAQELNVDGVLEGSVRREGQRVRITAQLIHARTEKHLWADSYERDVQDVLTLQNDVARAIAKSIRALLTSDEKARLGTTRQINPRAYEAYLKGLFHWNKATPEGARKSSEYFEQVIQIDPSYAPAHARLALSHTLLAALRPDEPPMEIYPKAQAAALKALELDPTSADAHAALAVVRYKGQWNWAQAEKEFKTALELDSNSSAAHVAYGNFLETLARFDEAIAELKRAEELDPLSVVNMVVLGATYLSARQYALATKEALKALEIDPNFGQAHFSLGLIHLAQERYEEAMSEFAKASELL